MNADACLRPRSRAPPPVPIDDAAGRFDGGPAARALNRLRRLQLDGFAAVHKDEQYLAEAAKLKLDISPIGADEILSVVDQIGKAPPAVLEHIRKLQADNKGG